eukprot:2017076-Prorocentrum_lima.AAC.1
MASVPPPVARQEAYSASRDQPCSDCQHHSSRSYFESMDPDTDTDSNLTDHGEDEEYHRVIYDNDPVGASALLGEAYFQAKRRWRKFTGRPSRRRRFNNR